MWGGYVAQRNESARMTVLLGREPHLGWRVTERDYAIVQEPSVLLLDEPTSALDLCRQMPILRVIRDVVDHHNVATVMTMHDLNLALRFADRFLFMKDERIYAACDRSGVTADMIEAVYSIWVDILMHKGLPMVVPRCEQSVLLILRCGTREKGPRIHLKSRRKKSIRA